LIKNPVTNLQGDVISVIDAWGAEQGSYEYDPYGNILSCTGWAATFNPLRYRGYYYDTETELYYLQSRYYDPSLGRFLNADVYASTGQGLLGNNMFAYCRNNPVSRKDISGRTDVAIADDPVKDLMNNQFEQGGGAFGSGNAGAGYGFLELIRLIVEAITEEPPAIPEKKKEKERTDPEPPDVTYPGDPSDPPGEDYEWRGKQPVGGDKGSWVNGSTGEQWHPDLNHLPPKGPHWDYTDIFGVVWSVFEDGRVLIWGE
jgi:RHS repeat-associated protein